MTTLRERIEQALDSGRLFIVMASGREWRARRNGVTKLWKTRPADFSIPAKCGLKTCVRITPAWIEGTHFTIRENV